MTRSTSPTVPLLEDVDAEAAETEDRVRRVDLEVILEFLLLASAHDAERHRDGVFLGKPAQLRERHEVAADP
jgi:hypothetical protein